MPRKRQLREESSSSSGRKSKKEDETFPLLSLPTEILFQIYIHLDYATRRALRVNGKLAEIEKQTKYRCEELIVRDDVTGVYIIFDGAELEIPHSEVEKEFEMMRDNTTFCEVTYCEGSNLVDRRSLDAICLIKAEEMGIRSTYRLNDDDLESLVKNNKDLEVIHSSFTENVIVRIYEIMSHSQIDGKGVTVYFDSANHLWDVIDKFGTFNRETLQFTATNPSQVVHNLDDNGLKSLMIIENNLEIFFDRIDGNSGDIYLYIHYI